MESRFLFSIVLIFVAVFSSSDAYEKKCIAYCGEKTGIDCPSNYTCQDWDGCGPSCLRSKGYQPDYCPMVNCMATNCPLGFERNERGCEGCLCAHMDVIKAIENEHYPGSAPHLASHFALCLALAYTILNQLR